MKSKDKKEAIVELGCEYAESIGCAWTSHLAIYARGKKIQAVLAGEDFREEATFPVVDSLWRSIAEFLAGNVDGWGVPLQSVRWSFSQVLEPWQLSIVDLCWPREDGEDQSGLGQSALTLPDAWLEEAFTRYGSLTYDQSGDLKKSWAGVLDLIGFVFSGTNITPEAFLESHSPRSKSPLWAIMRILRRRQRELGAVWKELYDRIESDEPQAKSFGTGMARSHRISQRCRAIRKEYLLSGNLPETH